MSWFIPYLFIHDLLEWQIYIKSLFEKKLMFQKMFYPKAVTENICTRNLSKPRLNKLVTTTNMRMTLNLNNQSSENEICK